MPLSLSLFLSYFCLPFSPSSMCIHLLRISASTKEDKDKDENVKKYLKKFRENGTHKMDGEVNKHALNTISSLCYGFISVML